MKVLVVAEHCQLYLLWRVAKTAAERLRLRDGERWGCGRDSKPDTHIGNSRRRRDRSAVNCGSGEQRSRVLHRYRSAFFSSFKVRDLLLKGRHASLVSGAFS